MQGEYRGFQILGPPPPSSAGVHIVQMLNILEAYDIGSLGFGSVDAVHLLAEALKIAFADRAVATADPAFVHVPVEQLTSKAYGAERRATFSQTVIILFTILVSLGLPASEQRLSPTMSETRLLMRRSFLQP